MRTNRQQGFTLIELVMVIVILGILAATALPRFANMQVDARIATLNGAFGAVNSAMAIVHSQALVNNQVGPAGSVNLETGAVALVFGYPAATITDINAAVRLSNEFTVAGTGPITITPAGATTPASCVITYAAATAANAPATAAVVTTGC